MLRRWFSHLTTTHFRLRRCFPAELLAAIDAAITASEQMHMAEIRFFIETALPIGHLWRGVSCRQRAGEIFRAAGMGETRAHNGILVYILLGDREIEIIADRGFSDRVPEPVWAEVCSAMVSAFRSGEYGPGCLQAIRRLSELAAAHFPPVADNRNELPNRPVLL